MKGKRYSTEDKIRILRQVDAGQSIGEVCREHNLSEVSFHRWKKQFGQMEVNEAKRMKELGFYLRRNHQRRSSEDAHHP